jgi:hypothetical protein
MAYARLRLRAIVRAQPWAGDLADAIGLLDDLGADLGRHRSGPYAAVCPLGTYQGKTLAYVVAAERGRDWIAWALDQAWPQDAAFAAALRLVAAQEGIA